MVDDAAFEGNASLAPEKIQSDYDGILIFGVTLHPRDHGLLPTRSQLAEITRALRKWCQESGAWSCFSDMFVCVGKHEKDSMQN